MSGKSESTILRNAIKSQLQTIGYDDELIRKLQHHCWNLNCERYDKYKEDNSILEMTYGDLIDFINKKYLKGYRGTDCAHITSVKQCIEAGYKHLMNKYMNGIFLCKECHDFYDNWNAGAGKNTKRARTNQNSTSGRQNILTIYEMKQKSMEFFK